MSHVKSQGMSQSLYVEQVGNKEKPALVLIHGWGIHSGIWKELLPYLTDDFSVWLVDLPGMGRSQPLIMEYDVERISELIVNELPEQFILLGWSLGATIAFQIAADYTDRVMALVNVCGNPCFVARDNWPCAMTQKSFDMFYRRLADNWKDTLNRFVALEAQGSSDVKQAVREIKAMMFVHGEPEAMALQGGLSLLRDVDLRDELAALSIPVLHLLAERDLLVPQGLSVELSSLAEHHQVDVLRDSNHVPFLKAPAEFSSKIKLFAAASYL